MSNIIKPSDFQDKDLLHRLYWFYDLKHISFRILCNHYQLISVHGQYHTLSIPDHPCHRYVLNTFHIRKYPDKVQILIHCRLSIPTDNLMRNQILDWPNSGLVHKYHESRKQPNTPVLLYY